MPLGNAEEHFRHSLDLPPPFRAVTLREAGDAFEHACRSAAELGAGTLVVVGRFDLAEFALVLEPEEPLAVARRIFFGGMTALVDALSAVAPPQRSIAIDWPGTLLVDGGPVGGGRLGWPRGTKETMVPEWLVFGGMIRTVSMSGAEAGLHPMTTALQEEGFDPAGSDRLLEGFTRHFLTVTDCWYENKFAVLLKSYAAKLRSDESSSYKIDEQGDLLIRRPARPVERRKLRSALDVVSWLDPDTGVPKI